MYMYVVKDTVESSTTLCVAEGWAEKEICTPN